MELNRWLWGSILVVACCALAVVFLLAGNRHPSFGAFGRSAHDSLAVRRAAGSTPAIRESLQAGHSVSAETQARSELESALRDLLAPRKGRFAVAVYDFQSGDSVLVNGHEVLHAASLIKLPIMMALYELVDSGGTDLDQTVAVKSTYRSVVDSREFRVSPVASLPAKPSLRRLLDAMITVSDNVAANVLIDFLTISRISSFLTRHGYRETCVRRYLMDERAFQRGIDNTMTAYDAMKMLRDLETGHGFVPGSCREMLQFLKRQTHNDKIPAVLPKDVGVAHKTGSISNVEHDAGIVYMPSGRKYVLAFMSAGLPRNGDGVEAARVVSKTTYQHFAGRPGALSGPTGGEKTESLGTGTKPPLDQRGH
jgi:beta-lactamase class A